MDRADGPPVTDMKRIHEATHVLVRVNGGKSNFAFDGRAMPIALDVGEYVWVHASYADEMPAGSIQVGDGRSPAYDQHGNRIVSVPATWCQFLNDEEAEGIELRTRVETRYLSGT
jgi:hypothetical protein